MYDRLGTIITLAVKPYEPIKFSVDGEGANEFDKIRDKFIDEKKDAIINSIDDIECGTRRLIKNCDALYGAGASLDEKSREMIKMCIKDVQSALTILLSGDE